MELRAICKVKPHVIGLGAGHSAMIAFVERAHPYWKITAPECGCQRVVIEPEQFQNGDIEILRMVTDIVKNDIVSTVDTFILQNEYPTIEEILEMYDKSIKSEDINGLRESEILALYTVEDLSSNLTKCLIQNEYLTELIKNLYFNAESSKKLTIENLTGKNNKEGIKEGIREKLNKASYAYGEMNMDTLSKMFTNGKGNITTSTGATGAYVPNKTAVGKKQRAANFRILDGTAPTEDVSYGWKVVDTPISFVKSEPLPEPKPDISVDEDTTSDNPW